MAQISMPIKSHSVSEPKWKYILRQLYKGRAIYMIMLPGLLFYLIFEYLPMYGVLIAFKDYKPRLGIMGSPWAGFKHFIQFFDSYYFWRIIMNTVVLHLYGTIFSFPVPIILALMLNEVKNKYFKKTIQTITYMPHFISTVVIIGLVVDFLSTKGLINSIITAFGGQSVHFMLKPEWFRTIYISSGIWKDAGWGTIVYLAALAAIDVEQYEAAIVDGANRWKRMLHITLPGIAPTIIILLILNLGHLMSVGFEKTLLMQNPLNMETADVIQTYVYRQGLIEFNYSFSTAVSLFNSAINFTLIIIVNKISRKVTESSLW